MGAQVILLVLSYGGTFSPALLRRVLCVSGFNKSSGGRTDTGTIQTRAERRPVLNGPHQADLCLRAFRHNKF